MDELEIVIESMSEIYSNLLYNKFKAEKPNPFMVTILSGRDGDFPAGEWPKIYFEDDCCRIDFIIDVGEAKVFRKSDRDNAIANIIDAAKAKSGVKRFSHEIVNGSIMFNASVGNYNDLENNINKVLETIYRYLNFIHFAKKEFNSPSFKSYVK